MPSKWEQYSYNEIKEMLKSSTSITDWGKKMGYSSFSKSKAIPLFKKYPDLEEIADKIIENYLNKDNLVGQKFGRLTVKKFSEEVTKEKNNGCKYWECECDCGNIIYTFTSRLKRGQRKSCGCLQKEIAKSHKFIDLTGQHFGKLTVIEQGERPANVNNTRAYWWCKCSCGNPDLILVSGQLLRNGHVSSCGCIKSQYEEKAKEILRKNNINYQTEYTFNDLLSPNNKPLRFDFAIFDDNGKLSHLIEIQGQQHFKSVNGWGGEEKFQSIQQYDQLKRDYCKSKQIELIEISYKDIIDENSLKINQIGE